MKTPRLSGLVSALAVTLLFSALAVAPAQAKTIVFSSTGEHTFTVPAGITSLDVFAVGGRGGDTPAAAQGGQGAEVTGTVSVTPGQTLYVLVGANGGDADLSAAGGFNGGGDGGGEAGGGGGASDVRTSPEAAGLTPDTRLIVAAGGGGAGGVGGSEPGGGGDAESPGFEEEEGITKGGAAGTQQKGGEGGFGCGNSGEDGILGIGGEGGAPTTTGPGGGGGGGFYGGGGGGGACLDGGGGGGGGSSLVPAGGSAKVTTCCIEPQVRITVAPAIAISSPGDGASYTQGQVVNASYSCTPAEGATVKSCAGPVASGAPIDTSTLGSHSFTVNTEDQEGAKGSKTVSYTVVAPQATPPVTPPVTPQTKLGSHPKKTIKTKKNKVKVKFGFSSSVAGATFKCKLDKGKLASCTSPKTYKVKPGKHTFSVVASSGGVQDPTPATFSFKVKKTK